MIQFDYSQPLANRMRPASLETFIGQRHIVGKNGSLRKLLEKKYCPSLIFWGPPGVGKTTLALIIAKTINLPFIQLSAINAGVKDVREAIGRAQVNGKTLLFIDEIHRFNKSQQDALLGAVEKGIITLIGATTENPSFEVNAALLSRMQVYVLQDLSEEDLKDILHQALELDESLQQKTIEIKEYDSLLRLSGGDARTMLNLLELVCEGIVQKGSITNKKVEQVANRKLARYDKNGEQHYDIISAFIKSMRGSDPNAAVYYLARMIQGGEDPKFIARRMLILASEDIGNANPNALLLANACFDAVTKIGYPECRIILSQTVVYLATSPKSNASYMAIKNAEQLVQRTGDLPVPMHLRNAPTKLMKKLDYGKNYQYAHHHDGNFVSLEFMPDVIKGTALYVPGNNKREQEIAKGLKQLWKEKYGY